MLDASKSGIPVFILPEYRLVKIIDDGSTGGILVQVFVNTQV